MTSAEAKSEARAIAKHEGKAAAALFLDAFAIASSGPDGGADLAEIAEVEAALKAVAAASRALAPYGWKAEAAPKGGAR